MITAEQTLVGKLNLDVEYVYPDLQEKSMKPKTEAQTVVPDEDYYGLSEVTVSAVTSDIDSNIKPENIVEGINILGVEGTAAFPTLGMKTITEDGIYKASDDNLGGYSEVDVDVGSSYFNTSPSANTTLIGTITKIPFIDTSKYTSMYQMFSDLSSLKKVNLSGYDISNVTTMSYMFSNCSALEELNLEGLDTSKVTNMQNMFSGCNALEELNLEGWDTSKVTNMSSMFSGCLRIYSFLDTIANNLNTSAVADMSYMFSSQYGRNDTNYVLNFDTSNVVKFISMFGWSYGKKVSIPTIDFSKATNIYGMFGGINGVVELNDHHNLGKAYLTSASANSSNYELDISRFTDTPKENLIEIINGLYDIKTKGVKSQQLILGSTNLAKLTSEEINGAVQKGWTVS